MVTGDKAKAIESTGVVIRERVRAGTTIRRLARELGGNINA